MHVNTISKISTQNSQTIIFVIQKRPGNFTWGYEHLGHDRVEVGIRKPVGLDVRKEPEEGHCIRDV